MKRSGPSPSVDLYHQFLLEVLVQELQAGLAPACQGSNIVGELSVTTMTDHVGPGRAKEVGLKIRRLGLASTL